MSTTIPQPPEDSTTPLAAVLSFLSRTQPYVLGPVAGAFTLHATGDMKMALLACILGPPAVAGGRVLAKWIVLLEPPTR